MPLTDEDAGEVQSMIERMRQGVIDDVTAAVERTLSAAAERAARAPEVQAPRPSPVAARGADLATEVLLRMVEAAERRAERAEERMADLLTRAAPAAAPAAGAFGGLSDLLAVVERLRGAGLVGEAAPSVGAIVASKLCDKADPLLSGLGDLVGAVAVKMANESEIKKSQAQAALPAPRSEPDADGD